MKWYKNPRELSRFRVAASVVLVLCGLIFTLIFLYGDSPRPIVERLNWLLSTLLAIALCVLVHAYRRFRRACAGPVDEFDV